jgi:hypothetical protein
MEPRFKRAVGLVGILAALLLAVVPAAGSSSTSNHLFAFVRATNAGPLPACPPDCTGASRVDLFVYVANLNGLTDVTGRARSREQRSRTPSSSRASRRGSSSTASSPLPRLRSPRRPMRSSARGRGAGRRPSTAPRASTPVTWLPIPRLLPGRSPRSSTRRGFTQTSNPMAPTSSSSPSTEPSKGRP